MLLTLIDVHIRNSPDEIIITYCKPKQLSKSLVDNVTMQDKKKQYIKHVYGELSRSIIYY